MYKVGEILTKAALTKAYGKHYLQVIGERLKAEPRKRKEMQRYKVVKPMPTKDEYIALHAKRFTSTVEALVADAQTDLEDLKQELQDWYDNLPAGFQSGEKGDMLQTAIDAMDSVSIPSDEIPAGIGDWEVYNAPADTTSRAKRAEALASMLESVSSSVRDQLEELPDEEEEDQEEEEKTPPAKQAEGKTEDAAAPEVDRSGAEEFCDALESAAEDIRNVEFPGAY